MIRRKPVQDLLYSDAIRRQEQQRRNEFEADIISPKAEKNLNLNNEKFAAQKFIK